MRVLSFAFFFFFVAMLNSVIQHLYILPGCSLAGSVYRSIKKLIYQRVVNVSTNPLPLVAASWDQAWGGGVSLHMGNLGGTKYSNSLDFLSYINSC